jgi:hypothetical protein
MTIPNDLEEAMRKVSTAAARQLEKFCGIDLASSERVRDEAGYKALFQRLVKSIKTTAPAIASFLLLRSI